MKVIGLVICVAFLVSPCRSEASSYQVDCYFRSLYGDNPSAFEDVWTQILTGWSRSIPTLSPDEKKWLDRELNSGDANRQIRALNSNEYALSEAALIIGNMLYVFRNRDYSEPEKYLNLASYLHDYDANGRQLIQRLVDNNLLTIPSIVANDERIKNAIVSSISYEYKQIDTLYFLQKHILQCFIPQLLNEQK